MGMHGRPHNRVPSEILWQQRFCMSGAKQLVVGGAGGAMVVLRWWQQLGGSKGESKRTSGKQKRAIRFSRVRTHPTKSACASRASVVMCRTRVD